MAWLKVDDGLAEHRKILALKRSDRWTWMELLCFVARQNNGGHVPTGVGDAVKHVTRAFLDRCEQVGLIDVEDDGRRRVHDWEHYNPKDPNAAERMRRYRGKRNNDA